MMSAREQLAFFAKFIKPHKKVFIWGLVFSLIYGVSGGAGMPFVVNYVFKNIFEDTSHAYTIWEIVGVAATLPAIFIVNGVFGFLGAYLMADLGLRVSVGIKQALFEKLQTMSLTFFSRRSTGDLLTRVQNDAEKLQFVIVEVAAECIRQPLQAAAAFGYLIYYSVVNSEIVFIFFFLIGIPLMMIPVRVIAKKLRHRSVQIQETTATMTQQISENLGALVEVRSFGMEKEQSKGFERTNQLAADFMLKQKKYERIQQPLSEVIVSLFIAASFVYCYEKGIGFDVFLTLGVALYKIFDPIKRVTKLIGTYNQNEASVYRVREILDMEPDIQDAPGARPLPQPEGRIGFDGVTFAYETEAVLKDVSIDIPSGTVCALVGPSGAGKSTFANLIPRFYEPNAGSITLDGHDLKDITLESLRSHIAIVSQTPVLFNDSLANNIRQGRRDATDEEVIEAAKKAYAHDFITASPRGYETLAGERGGQLSGGQRQRIALARAFLKNAPILILDEATSALDSESEHYIQLALEELTRGKTVIVVAHRLSTIKSADMICVFDQGHIVATGSHSELVTTSPLYRMLCERQSLD